MIKKRGGSQISQGVTAETSHMPSSSLSINSNSEQYTTSYNKDSKDYMLKV